MALRRTRRVWRSSRTRRAVFASTARDDAVHLPVTKALSGEEFRRALFDAAAIGANLPASGDAPGARLAGAVAQAFGQHDAAVFEMAVNGALRGKARTAFTSKRVQAGGDGEALREEVNKALGKTDWSSRNGALWRPWPLRRGTGRVRIHPAVTRWASPA